MTRKDMVILLFAGGLIGYAAGVVVSVITG